MEVIQQCIEERSSKQNKYSQTSNEVEFTALNIDYFEMEDKGETLENKVINDNNNVVPLNTGRKENGCSLIAADGSDHGLPDKKINTNFDQIRNGAIKKKCIGCDKIFDGQKGKYEHELVCGLNYFNRKFNCIFCDRPFGRPKALRKHENKHRPAKKYLNQCVCVECNRTFDAIYSLRVHMKKLHRKVHGEPFDKKPFACSMCEARFKYENSKHKHEVRCHSADLDLTLGYSSGDGAYTNFIPSDSDGIPVVCKLENIGPDHVIKREPDDNLCGESSSENLTENKVINPVHVPKMEIEADMNPFNGDVSNIKTEDGHKASGREHNIKEAVEKIVKKQKTGNNSEEELNSLQGPYSYHQSIRTKRLSCIGCGEAFQSEKDTEEHELRCDLNHNEYVFSCLFCDENFGTPKLLRYHELKHGPQRKTKDSNYMCIDYRKSSDSIHPIKEHVRECPKTGIKVRNEGEEGTRHEKRTISLEDMMSCYVVLNDIGQGTPESNWGKGERSVAAKYKQEPDLLEVIKVKEERDYNTIVCDISGSEEECKVEDIKIEFPDDLIEAPAYLVETELANPEAIYPEETELFQCGKCNAIFDSFAKLRHHSYSHRRRLRLFCIGCGEGFEQRSVRDKHELECSVNLTDRHFNCIFCELPFDYPKTLRNHEKKHRPPKRYKHMCLCAECDRAFDAVHTLKIHIRNMHRRIKEKISIKQEVEDVNFESNLTLKEYKPDDDLKTE